MHPNTTKCTNSWVYRPMGWIGCVHCEKLWCDFVARTSSLIALVQPVLHRVSCSNEKYPKCTQTVRNKPILEFRVQWGGSGAFWCKSKMQFGSTQNAPVQPILHRVPGNNETLRNAPTHYEMLENMSLGSNGVDRVRSLPKITMRACGTKFCINCTSSTYFAPSFMQYWNNPKCTQTLRNAPIHEFRVQWDGSGAFIAKKSDAISWHELLH